MDRDALQASMNAMVETVARASAMIEEAKLTQQKLVELERKMIAIDAHIEERVKAAIVKNTDRSVLTKATIIKYMKKHNMLNGE